MITVDEAKSIIERHFDGAQAKAAYKYGDKFYMIRTGEGKNGVVMRGTIIGTPYPDEDWSGKGRKVYYIRMSLTGS